MIEGRSVAIRAWRYEVRGIRGGSLPAYFLDNDLDSNTATERSPILSTAVISTIGSARRSSSKWRHRDGRDRRRRGPGGGGYGALGR